MIGFIDYGVKTTFTGALVLGSIFLSAHFYKSTSASESYFLCFYMRPPFQISSVRPVTVLLSALAPSPRQRPLCYIHFTSQRPFGLLTLKGRAVFQHPRWCDLQRYEGLFYGCPDMKLSLSLPTWQARDVSQSSWAPLQELQQVQLRAQRVLRWICAELISIHLVWVRRPAKQTGILCLFNQQQHRADMSGVPSEACLHVRAHADVLIRHKKRRKLMLFDRDCVFLDHDTWPVVQRTE